MKKDIFKKILSVVITIALCISVGLCCIVAMKSVFGRDQTSVGFRFFYLVSGSMEPTIPTGAAVLTHKQETYEVGDVITFISTDSGISGYANTHRIVGVTEKNGKTAYITKGDANAVEDSTLVYTNAIYGKVICHTGKALWLGTLVGMLTTPLGFVSIIIVPALAVVAWLMRSYTQEYKKALAEEMQKAAQAAQTEAANGAAGSTTSTEE